MENLEQYLTPTEIIDCHHPEIRSFAEKALGDANNPVDKAVRLYYAVRDGIWYDPYYPFYLPEHYRASNVLKSRRGFCIPKASLLCASARACGIPCRIGFANVRNHLATRQLLDFMGTDIFVFHAFNEFFLEGRWVKATPAFNKELCERFGVEPLEFNGRQDSLFQPYNYDKRKFMEYLEFLGSFADVPVNKILSAFERTYGTKRVRGWIRNFEMYGSLQSGPFDAQDMIK